MYRFLRWIVSIAYVVSLLVATLLAARSDSYSHAAAVSQLFWDWVVTLTVIYIALMALLLVFQRLSPTKPH